MHLVLGMQSRLITFLPLSGIAPILELVGGRYPAKWCVEYHIIYIVDS